MIKPTIGRVVWFYPAAYELSGMQSEQVMISHDPAQPFVAHIAYVWSDTCVNLAVFDHQGYHHRRTSVPINLGNQGGSYAEWMPYQKGQAAKAEKAESDLDTIKHLASAGSPLI